MRFGEPLLWEACGGAGRMVNPEKAWSSSTLSTYVGLRISTMWSLICFLCNILYIKLVNVKSAFLGFGELVSVAKIHPMVTEVC